VDLDCNLAFRRQYDDAALLRRPRSFIAYVQEVFESNEAILQSLFQTSKPQASLLEQRQDPFAKISQIRQEIEEAKLNAVNAGLFQRDELIDHLFWCANDFYVSANAATLFVRRVLATAPCMRIAVVTAISAR
jgi:hypothetical protein